MNGNREMGVESRGTDAYVTPWSDASISEIVYVGRASFRVAHDVDLTPQPTADVSAWFTPASSELLAGSDGSNDAAEASGPEADVAPVVIDSWVYGTRDRARRRWLKPSAWTIGPAVIAGAFVLGMLLSPLAMSSLPHRSYRKVPSRPVAHSVPSIIPIVPIVPIVPIAALETTDAATPPVVKPIVKTAATKFRPMKKHGVRAKAGASAEPPAAAPWVDPWAS